MERIEGVTVAVDRSGLVGSNVHYLTLAEVKGIGLSYLEGATAVSGDLDAVYIIGSVAVIAVNADVTCREEDSEIFSEIVIVFVADVGSGFTFGNGFIGGLLEHSAGGRKVEGAEGSCVARKLNLGEISRITCPTVAYTAVEGVPARCVNIFIVSSVIQIEILIHSGGIAGLLVRGKGTAAHKELTVTGGGHGVNVKFYGIGSIGFDDKGLTVFVGGDEKGLAACRDLCGGDRLTVYREVFLLNGGFIACRMKGVKGITLLVDSVILIYLKLFYLIEIENEGFGKVARLDISIVGCSIYSFIGSHYSADNQRGHHNSHA